MDSPSVQSLYQTATAHLHAGRTQAAVNVLLEIASAYPNEPRSRFTLAVIAHQSGQLPLAFEWLNKTLAIDPTMAEPHYLAGVMFQQQNQLPAAIDAYQKFLTRKLGDGKGLNNLGRAILDLGKIDEGIAVLRQAIAAVPPQAGAHNNLGDALRKQGDFSGAMEQYRKAIAMDANCAEAHGNLGILLVQQGKSNEAAASMQRAIAINPRLFNPHFNLARVHQDAGRLEDAMQQCRLALDLRPNSAEAHNLLGNLLGQAGQIPQCIAAQQRAVQLKPDFASAHSNLLLSMQYVPEFSAQELFAAHLQWASQHARPIQNAVVRNDRNKNQRLRIGYVSPNFNAHSVAYFFEPVLAAHDKNAVDIFCYSDVARGDATTLRIMNLSGHWREIAGKSDAEVTAMIRQDQIDIIVDLAGHTAGNRLPLFAQRPAPVQMSWIGYPATTGMAEMDYRITDPIADPPGSEAFHTEKLLRIDGGCWAYQAPVSPAIGPFPAIANGFVTFGSFNNLPKITPVVIQTWAKILTQIPSSRMLLKSAGLGARLARDYVLGEFAKHGIHADRIELLNWAPSTLDHFQLYNRVDIALDTFPYNGTTTTCEALWMGVPVVTFAGSSHISRVGAALLTHAGLAEWIAPDIDGYIALAVRMAGKLGRLEQMRRDLRELLIQSPVGDADRLARALEKCYAMVSSQLRPAGGR